MAGIHRRTTAPALAVALIIAVRTVGTRLAVRCQAPCPARTVAGTRGGNARPDRGESENRERVPAGAAEAAPTEADAADKELAEGGRRQLLGVAWPWNVLGRPGVNVPAGFVDDGLPVGAQLLGPANSEPLLLWPAAQLETDQRRHERWPPQRSTAGSPTV
ncbi:amidase family protein [Streptomyces europaeiscabiei]|uniref:amidase family protein n=1 Tax=Streptomyces europaeiscabiei TaxID=146819 RepID=UPI002E10D3DD|nr:amidase family protein [Streptomyces europaeiscabiei]